MILSEGTVPRHCSTMKKSILINKTIPLFQCWGVKYHGVHADVLLWSPAGLFWGEGDVDCCAHCSLSPCSGAQDAVLELPKGSHRLLHLRDVLCRGALVRNLILQLRGGECWTSKPGFLVLCAPMGAKGVAACDLPVRGIKGPEEQRENNWIRC